MTTLVANFRSKSLALVEGATGILDAEHPMTLRQLYYRCVSVGLLRNAQSEYKRLGNVMTRLREAGDIPLTWIVDHVRTTLKPSSWSGLADFGDTVREAYRKDFWSSLPVHVEVFVEKDAIAGTIQPVTDKYDIGLRVCRGYSSISFAGGIAAEWDGIEKPIFAYYLGDYDPSGFDIERDLRGKLERYSGRCIWDSDDGIDHPDESDAIWSRLAVVADDFDDFNLICLEAKRTDKRYAGFVEKYGDDCTELDALPPVELRRRVEDAIIRHIDKDKWERLQQVEAVERESMQAAVAGWGNDKLNLVKLSGRNGPKRQSPRGKVR